ncbi:AAA family ATPase [Micrococcus lacusdianchii]|uniref:AAA family ATPase n=1 Tax=Micrococcus lacusdianchii TaxID=2915940 RepID=UPI002002F496
MRVSLAVVVPEGSDLVGALERAQAEITVVRRAADLAELIAVARSGLVDAVLVAQGADQLGRGVLEEMARAPRPVGVSAMSEVREDRERLRALGVPCLRVDVEPLALAAAVQEAVRAAHTGRTAGMPVDPEDRDPAEVPAESGAPSDAPGPDPDRASGRPPAAPGLSGEAFDAGEDTGVAVVTDEQLAGLFADPADPVLPGGAEPDIADRPTDRAEERVPAPDDDPGDGAAGEHGRPVRPGTALVVVWGPTGAPGRTTVAVNLAAEYAVSGLRTLVVDLDTYGPAVGVHLGLTEETAGVARAAHRADRGPLSTEDLVDAAVGVRVAGGRLDVLTGLTRPERWPELRPSALRHVLTEARHGWDRVVVDVGFNLEQDEELSFDVPAPQRNGAAVLALSLADRVVAVGGADAVSLPRLLRALETLPEEVPTERVEVVMNRVRPQASGISPQAQVAGVWARYGPDLPLVAQLPWDPQAADRALFGGQVLAEAAPSGPLRRALRELALRDPEVAARASAGAQGRAGRPRAGGREPRRRVIPWPAPSRRTP